MVDYNDDYDPYSRYAMSLVDFQAVNGWAKLEQKETEWKKRKQSTNRCRHWGM
jgi:hypothetical protein